MKNIFILLPFLVLAFAHDTSKSFNVEGMHCDFGCVKKVKTVITALDGAQSCEVDFRQKKLTVIYNDDLLNSDMIIASLNENTTFTTTIIKDEKKGFWSKFKGLFGGNS